MKENNLQTGALSELPDELHSAVVEFRARHGARWKSTLLEGWVRAAYPGPLQQLRNNFGPSWLVRVTNAEFQAPAIADKAGDARARPYSSASPSEATLEETEAVTRPQRMRM